MFYNTILIFKMENVQATAQENVTNGISFFFQPHSQNDKQKKKNSKIRMWIELKDILGYFSMKVLVLNLRVRICVTDHSTNNQTAFLDVRSNLY